MKDRGLLYSGSTLLFLGADATGATGAGTCCLWYVFWYVFWVPQRSLMQSSMRAIRPVAIMTLWGYMLVTCSYGVCGQSI